MQEMKQRASNQRLHRARKKSTNIPTNTGCGALVGIKLHTYRQETRHATDMSSNPPHTDEAVAVITSLTRFRVKLKLTLNGF